MMNSLVLLAALVPSAALTPGKVIVVGSHNQDLITSGARIPRPGETVLHDTFSQAFGGKGANQAVQAALLGAKTHFVGKVGDDAYGKAALENLRDRGVIIDNVADHEDGADGRRVRSGRRRGRDEFHCGRAGGQLRARAGRY